ncbi:MAG: Fe-hydrogenase large subunit family protein, partial [Bilophila wadsworthia]
MVERNHINVLLREVLRRVAESFLHYADFGNSVERIPFVMRPKNTRPNRCCIYKDRAILRFQVMAALGFRLEDEEDDSTPLSVYAEKASLEREQPSAPI